MRLQSVVLSVGTHLKTFQVTKTLFFHGVLMDSAKQLDLLTVKFYASNTPPPSMF